MNNFGLDVKYIKFLKDVLTKYITDKTTKFYIFGSRAKGKYKKYSDIDIAIDNNEKIDNNILVKISSEFENSNFPYEVDVIDLNSISDTFKSMIQNDLVLLFSPSENY